MSNVTALKQEPEFSSQLEKIRHKVESTSDKWAVQAVACLIAASGDKAFELGGYLHRVHKDKLWPQEMSFVDWMDKQGILKSRGYALKDTYQAIISCDLPPDTLDRIGWSKLVMIVPMLKPEGDSGAVKFNDGLIATAEKLAQSQLREHVQKVQGKTAKKDTVKPVFILPEENEATFKAAVESAKKETEAKTEVEAVDAIMTGYLDGKSKTVTLQSMMKKCQPEEVLELFSKIWPDIDIKVSL